MIASEAIKEIHPQRDGKTNTATYLREPESTWFIGMAKLLVGCGAVPQRLAATLSRLSDSTKKRPRETLLPRFSHRDGVSIAEARQNITCAAFARETRYREGYGMRV